MAKPTSSNNSLTVNFAFKKATANTFCFDEIDEDGKVRDRADAEKVIGNLYVTKAALKNPAEPPKKLTVTITPA